MKRRFLKAIHTVSFLCVWFSMLGSSYRFGFEVQRRLEEYFHGYPMVGRPEGLSWLGMLLTLYFMFWLLAVFALFLRQVGLEK